MGRAAFTDLELVEATCGGQIDAFTVLVERYQSLVCAVSYSATGDRALSEDVAQETFVIAWNGLSELREPAKLRGWLCGIARNLSSKALRRVGREIPSDVEVQAALNEVAAGPSPLEHALDRELEQLVWTALQSVPETYREPLVLFYREDHSTTQVAEALGLSLNAVQQRLSRGRQHLKAGVAELVERTLERTKPSKRFAAGVVAAVSAGTAAGTAQAAALHATSSASSNAATAIALSGGLLTMKTIKLGAVAIIVGLLVVGGASYVTGRDSDAAADDDNKPTGNPAAVAAPQPQPPSSPAGLQAWATYQQRLARDRNSAAAAATPRPTSATGDSDAPAVTPRKFRSVLSEQLAAAEPAWQRCLREASSNKQPIAGVVGVRFIIAAPEGDDRAAPHTTLVELSEIDYDGTTVKHAGFLECMRRSPLSMSFEPLADDINAVAVGFKVRVADDATSMALEREYSFLRDSDPPID